MFLCSSLCVCFLLAPASAAPPQSTKEEEEDKEENRLKRKREDAESAIKAEEENECGEMKKVCKEGFQLFHHDVCFPFPPIEV